MVYCVVGMALYNGTYSTPPPLGLQIVEDASKGVHCRGLTETVVASVSDVIAIIHKAQEKRRVADGACPSPAMQFSPW
jgi:hypothetical protein